MAKPGRISAQTLKSWMDNPQLCQSFVVIDVRDEDRFGGPTNPFFNGRIRMAVSVPAATFIPALPSLSASLCNTKRVVFHCQISQQRGPSCAMAYARYISHILPNQEIYILDGGFNEWARLYGRDPRYTEAF